MDVKSHSATKGIELVWREGFIAFESRKSAFNGIMEALLDETIGIVGIVGMGGIGKTKLVTEIGKIVKDENFFHQVVMAVVSQNPNVRNIQGVLADMLDLQLNGKSEAERAMELHARLEKERGVLLILDDVWHKIDLKDIGIPSGHDNGSCKVIITTRSEQTCNDMGCNRRVLLDVLNEAEAVNLFKNYAGVGARSGLDKLVRKVVKECRGLPLALVVVGSALNDRSSEDYIDAIGRLAKSNFVDMESADQEIYPCLKLSYDYLDSEETRKCFLLCSLFPEECEIDLEKLTLFAVGQRIFPDVVSIEEARKEVYQSVKKLKDACLLIPQQNNFLIGFLDEIPTIPWEELLGVKLHSLKMHELVRDVALWISKNEVFVPTMGELSQPRWRNSGNVTAISYNSSDIGCKFPAHFEYPKLKMLILKQFTLERNCFRNMSNLEVLDIKESNFLRTAINRDLPISLEHLHNLKVLLFWDWHSSRLCSMDIIADLKNLEILSFRGSKIEGLSPYIGYLSNLRVLDITDCQCERWIARNILPRLTRLEELYTYTKCIDHGGWGYPGSADLSEISSLPRLVAFTAWINSIVSFPSDFIFPDLLRYSIVYSSENLHPSPYSPPLDCSRNLILEDLDLVSKQVFQNLIPQVGYLALGGLSYSFTNLVPQINDGEFNNLSQLYICNSASLKYLVSTTQFLSPKSIFSNLVFLSLFNNTELTMICEGQNPPDFLKNLKFFTVRYCSKLQNIFPRRLLHGPKLVTLEVIAIAEIEYVFELELELGELTCEDWVPFSLSSSSRLMFSSLEKLTSIWKLPHSMENVDGELHAFILEVYLRSLNSVEELTIENCNQLREVFQLDMVDFQKYKGQLSSLSKLELRGLSQLNSIWKGPPEIFSLHKLEHIVVDGCDMLTNLFTLSTAQGLLNLRFLTIANCKALERLIMWDANDTFSYPGCSVQPVRFPELIKIDIQSCEKLKGVLPVAVIAQGLSKLKSISIQNCANLEYVFGDGPEYVGESLEITLSNLHSLTLAVLPRLNNLLPENCQMMFPSLQELKVDEWPRNSKECVPWFFNHVATEDQDKEKACALMERLITIKKISIQNCEEVDELFNFKEVPHHQLGQPWFSRLTCLELMHLPHLSQMWSGDLHSVNLGCLTILRVMNCQSLANVLTPSLARTLRQLKELYINECCNLESFIAQELPLETDDYVDGVAEFSCFPNLLIVHVAGCHKLRNLFPLSMVPTLPLIGRLNIRACHNLEQVFFDDGIDQGGHDIENLVEMKFQVLAFLHLVELPRLTSFAPLNYYITCPSLVSISLRELTMFTIFDAENIWEATLREAQSSNTASSQFSLQPRNTSTRALITTIYDRFRFDINLENYDVQTQALSAFCLDLCQPDWKEELPFRLGETEDFRKFNGLFPIREPKCINMLQHLIIESCSITEVFDMEILISQDDHTTLLYLELLTLRRLPYLKCIWKGCPRIFLPVHLTQLIIHDCKVLKSLFTYDIAQNLLSLVDLEVWNCAELEHIIEPRDIYTYANTFLILKLKHLTVQGCEKLKTVFPLSLSRSLRSLEDVTIRGSSELEHIFVNDNDQQQWFDKVERFVKLESLGVVVLDNLPKLRSFVPPPYDFCMNDLVQLDVEDCPLLSTALG